MSVFNRVWRFWKGANRSGMVKLTGSVLIGSSGAVTSYDFPGCSVTLVNSKTGRYRIQLLDNDGSTAAVPSQPTNAAGTAITPWGIQGVNAIYVSPVADNALTTNAGIKFAIRNFTPLSGYFDLQCYKDVTSTTDETHVDAHPESGSQLLIALDVKLSSVTP